jgi:hypothetical protein
MKTNLQTEKVMSVFFSTGTWDYFWTKKRKSDIPFLFKKMLPMFLEKLDSLKDVVDLTKKSFTMSDFHKICKARAVSVVKQRRIANDSNKPAQGQYSVDPKTLREYIWIEANLPRNLRLFAAAHEISHKLLHRESLLKPRNEFRLASDIWGLKLDTETRLVVAEIEADLLASFMIARKD